MKRIYIILCLACLSLAGCHEVTVGYLKAGHAAYPIDSLCIYDAENVKEQIAELDKQKMSPRDSLLIVRDSLGELSLELSVESYSYFFTTVRPLALELETIDSVANKAHYDEVNARYLEVNAKYEEMEAEAQRVEEEYQEVKHRLQSLDPGSDMAAESVREQLKGLKARLLKKIPWTTVQIAGVDGTAPVLFEVAGVWAEEGGDAEIFRQQLKMKGGGRMEVPFEFKFPAGRYHVSVTIRNEGYSHTLENAFTFIVRKGK